MTLTIEHERGATRDEWRAIWEGSDSSTYFQSPEWAEIWERHSGGRLRPAAKLLRFSDGVEALLPLVWEVKAAGLLNRFVSSPEGTYGGWLCKDRLTLSHAVLLTQWLLSVDGSNLVWRLNPFDPLVFRAAVKCGVHARYDETHAVRLNADATTLLRGFKKGCREDIKKARKRGSLEVRVATRRCEWQAYHRVYQDSLVRWGHRADDGYPWSLFETIFEAKSEHVKLWLARFEGQIVSGELTFYAGSHAVSWHAATLHDYLRTGVGKFQTFEIIKDCCASGYRWLDFNPSAGLAGVQGLKESFRAQAMPAPLVYVDAPLKRWVRRAASALDVRDAKLSLRPLALPTAHPTAREAASNPKASAPRASRRAGYASRDSYTPPCMVSPPCPSGRPNQSD